MCMANNEKNCKFDVVSVLRNIYEIIHKVINVTTKKNII